MTHLNVSLGPDAGITVPLPAQRPARFRIGSPALTADPALEPINAVALLAQIEAAKRYARTIVSPVSIGWAHVALLAAERRPSTPSAQTRAEIRQESEDLAKFFPDRSAEPSEGETNDEEPEQCRATSILDGAADCCPWEVWVARARKRTAFFCRKPVSGQPRRDLRKTRREADRTSSRCRSGRPIP